ncbi:MAG: UDPGP type 1 family protein [Clostridia bacterium]|nr:UDPGP type 1 family protein [Clostridia bacterium]
MELDLIKKKLEAYGQSRLLEGLGDPRFCDDCRAEFIKKLEGIDFDLVRRLYEQAAAGASPAGAGTDGGPEQIAPIPVTDSGKLTPEQRGQYIAAGEAIIARGEFAAVTMAGGQGTRLGHNGPKGTYDIGVAEHSLFEIQASRLLRRAACSANGRQIPWYIMTSEENDAATREFFALHGYFGYDPANVRFFTQFMLPMVAFDGGIVRDGPLSVKMGADGHGGIFRAMHAHGITADMKARGVKYVFIGGIDNVLVKLCDPLFIGFTAACGTPCAGKSLIKRDPYEKAGVFCLRNGRPSVIEYTEISKEMAEARDARGEFVYGDAHILCNMFTVDALDAAGSEGLPYHVAVKKTKYIDDRGQLAEPAAPNAYKFEAFIFDAFSRADNMGILRVRREDEFAPVKNREGEDSPDTARALYESARERGALD